MFDGSGGFPLAASLCGIEPCWASEVEPYPIAVTRTRFPTMKHLGDISKINGAEIEPVDIITFGSPCQDLSVAGKRAGLEGARSGLFMEAVRIIKEMREATDGKYPTFALWENVPGAFSSNKGEDFRIVLEELIKISEPSAVMPEVPKKGWAYSDSYSGDGWSIAYRVFDAQYWGVPQRRRRIHLVADFRGQCARKVLFERKGLRGHLTESPPPRERVTAYVEVGPGATGNEERDVIGCDLYNYAETGNTAVTLTTQGGGTASGPSLMIPYETMSYGITTKGNGDAFLSEERHTALSTGGGQAGQGYPAAMIAVATQQGGAEISDNGICPTVTAAAGMSGNNQPWVVYNGENITHPFNKTNPKPGDPCRTLGTDSRNYLVYAIDQQGGKGGANYAKEVMPTICSDSHGTPHAVAYGISSYNSNAMKSDNPHSGIYEAETSRTLDLNGGNPTCNQGGIAVLQPEICSEGVSFITDKPSHTITNDDRHAVCYTVDQGGGKSTVNIQADLSPTLTCTHDGAPAVAYSMDEKMGQTYVWEGQANTLAARDYKQPQTICYERNGLNYIVRRLTPTECARLQGFPDKWGHPDKKDALTDEEYAFWLEVRNTHAAINGKAVKDYTKEQILKWYNKLHSGSAEYKMWGNGIALPPALYCMQGINESLHTELTEV